MTNARMRFALLAGATTLVGAACAQIPDLLSSFEMGGRGFGMGGAIYSNASDASASYWNPAGLGHIGQAQVEFNFRNRPTTRTTLGGTFVNPDREGTATYGLDAFSFIGAAVPMAGGTVGISYAVGGWAREESQGQNLGSGDPADPTEVLLRQEVFRVLNEFVTLAWGTGRGSTNFGVGLIFARQSILDKFFQRLQPAGGGPVIETEDEVAEAGTGFGGIVGFQYTPPGNPNVQFGASYRSEIRISGFDELSGFSNAIPARLQGGIVVRRDGVRGGRDFMVFGVDVSYFFAANRDRVLERSGQLSGGIGVEYNLAQNFGYLPIRAGVRMTQKAGETFADRTALTFGIGYRPEDANFWIDLAGGIATGQGRPDMAIAMSFLLGR